MSKNGSAKKTSRSCAPSVRTEIEQYRKLFEAIPDIIYKIDSEGNFVYVSESVRDLGYEPGELVGRHFSDIIHPRDVENISRRHVLPLFEGKKTGDDQSPKLFDERRTGKRGTRRLVVRFVPKYLRENFAPEEPEEAAEQFYGEVISFGDYLAAILRRHTDSMHETQNYSGVVYGEVSSSGHYAHASNSPEKKFEGSVGIIRNITDRVMLEQQKAHLEEQLQHSLKMEAIGQLTSGVAHDLNNVLCNVLGYAELIRESNAGTSAEGGQSDLVQRIDRMINAINSGITLTRSMLDFTRKAKTEKTVVNAHAIIGDVLHLLMFTLGKTAKIREDIRAENPFIVGDMAQLQNVLINIALNARDAMPQGGDITFATENIFVKSPLQLPAGQKSSIGEYLVISISDAGCGIDESVRSRLFEPFFTTKPQGKGTGLGLMNVLRIMKAHSGFVDVISAPGKGSTFRLYLPVTMLQHAPQTSGASKPAPELVPLYINGHVLVIDDDLAVCDVVKIALQNTGCQVTICSNPQIAAEIYRKHAADISVVLVDMLMPECNGFECLRQLREISSTVKALLITGLSDDLDPRRVLEKGFLGSIKKPFNIRQLVQAVAQAIKQR